MKMPVGNREDFEKRSHLSRVYQPVDGRVYGGGFSRRNAFQALRPQTYSQRVEKGFLGDRSEHMRICRPGCGGKRREIDMGGEVGLARFG